MTFNEWWEWFKINKRMQFPTGALEGAFKEIAKEGWTAAQENIFNTKENRDDVH